MTDFILIKTDLFVTSPGAGLTGRPLRPRPGRGCNPHSPFYPSLPGRGGPARTEERQ